MKKIAVLIISCSLMFSCVQKAYEQTVIYTVEIPDSEGVTSVGIRGNDKPLNWEQDTELKKINDKNIYQVKVTYLTGYKFTEVKFTRNGEYELQNMPNRRVEFNPSGITRYKAVFNQSQK
ncbi:MULTISPECIES: hypothetical protein [Chryseobacterium]|uniref:Oxidoreductase n=1 Tax=Chryseobacterium taihuense TaxID=1141221 RepID=A0A4U8W8F2_9FLAO|nr:MULTISPECIES: hypothetical protein [Chryseobacterium]QQV04109.1 hypothetical protein I6I61_07185 [Chryseobacterium sp. FDAARGOS 1104]VFB02527.1 Uncharacterised protein [Chryseobacterium taihuense]